MKVNRWLIACTLLVTAGILARTPLAPGQDSSGPAAGPDAAAEGQDSPAPAAGPDAAADAYKPQTTADPAVPVDQLELMVKPLTKGELIIEANKWLELLRKKVKEISAREIAVKKKNEQIDKAEEMAEAAEEAKEAKEEAEKAIEEARVSTDAEATKEAEEKAKEAEKKAREAKKAAEEAQEAEKKEDLEVQEATKQALKKAEDKAKEEAEEKDETTEAEDTAPAAPTEEEAKAPTLEAEDVEDTGKLQETAEAAQKAAETKEQVKDILLEDITELRAERTALTDRLNVVLDELEAKGGEAEVAMYRKYVTAVSGITLDVTDTSATWAAIVGWLKQDEGGLRWARNLSTFLATLLGFWILSILLGRAVDRATRSSKRMSVLLREFFRKIVRRTTLIVGIVVAVAALEININPLLAAIGGAAIVIAFALQGTLSNFASGILILTYRPFDVGDVVDAGGVSGKVESMNLVSTHIRTFDNKLMIVPNNEIWGNVITNATGTDKRRVDMVFGIGYGDDIAKAQKILEDILNGHELVLESPEAVIKLHELADSSVNFICRPWVKTADYWTVYWDVTRTVKEEFDKQGVSIPFPQRDLHIYQETPAPPEPAKAEL